MFPRYFIIFKLDFLENEIVDGKTLYYLFFHVKSNVVVLQLPVHKYVYKYIVILDFICK